MTREEVIQQQNEAYRDWVANRGGVNAESYYISYCNAYNTAHEMGIPDEELEGAT